MSDRPSLTTYAYNAKSGRYVNLATGRFVSPDTVRKLLADTIDAGFTRMSAFTANVANGNGNVLDLQDAMTSHLVDSHSAMYLLGRGGLAQMTPDDYISLQGRLEEEFNFLDGFMADLANGNLSAGQAQTRLNMYNEHIWLTYHDGETAGQAAAGYNEERRIAQDDERTCDDCIGYERLGWQPIGTLPNPGQASACRTKCRCTKEYRRNQSKVRGRSVLRR